MDSHSTTAGSVVTRLAYEPKPALLYASKVGLQASVVGVLVSAVQNALENHKHGAMGILTRTGSTIGTFALVGATFAFTEAAVANARATDDALNGASGGCAAGFIAGLRSRSLPTAVAGCAIMGGIMGTFDAAGSSLSGTGEQNRSWEERKREFFKPKPQPLKSLYPP